MTPDSFSALMRGAQNHGTTRSSSLDVDVAGFLGDLDVIERHAEDLRPSEDDLRGRVSRAAMVLSEYVLSRGVSSSAARVGRRVRA